MTNARTPHGALREQDGGMTGPRYSILPARAVFDKRLTLSEKVVLAALGTYTNEEGWCHPSQKTLCERLGIARSTVCAAIKRLASPDYGYLELRARTTSGRGKIGNEYRVKMDLAVEKPLSVVVDNGVKKPMSIQPDNGAQIIEVTPMSAQTDNGADVQPTGQPMSDQPDIAYIARTVPTERPQSNSKEELDSLVLTPPDVPKPKRAKAKRKVIAYTPEFNAVWKLWPADRRGNSDKGKAFERYQAGAEQFGHDNIAKAAKRYLSLPDTRKENYRFCCLVEVFMNGKLEAAVEAVSDRADGEAPTKAGYKFLGYRADGVAQWAKDHQQQHHR